MTGMNATISNNIMSLLRKNGKRQNDLADALGVSKQIMSNMLGGKRTINAVELREIADYFGVTMEKLMESSSATENTDAIHVFMGDAKTPQARKSLEIADKLADMVLYYARLRKNAEQMNQIWEA